MSVNRPENISSTGIPVKKDAFVVIVRTEWNASIIDELEKGSVSVLNEYHVKYATINVPGAFEISFAIKNHFDNCPIKPDAYIALGCVLRGDTPHFEYVCRAVTDGIVHLNMILPCPTIFGILTVDTQTQAEERIGGIHGHKGEEAALTALKMMAIVNSNKN